MPAEPKPAAEPPGGQRPHAAAGAIVSPAYDRLWFGAGAALVSAAFVGAGAWYGAGATLVLYVAFNALFNLPHQFCTWIRARETDGPVPRARWLAAGAIALAV